MSQDKAQPGTTDAGFVVVIGRIYIFRQWDKKNKFTRKMVRLERIHANDSTEEISSAVDGESKSNPEAAKKET